jgi:hypothetical protein
VFDSGKLLQSTLIKNNSGSFPADWISSCLVVRQTDKCTIVKRTSLLGQMQSFRVKMFCRICPERFISSSPSPFFVAAAGWGSQDVYQSISGIYYKLITIVSDACTITIMNGTSRSVYDTYRSVIDDSRVTLEIVASLYDRHGSRNVFIVEATGVNLIKLLLCVTNDLDQ